MVKPKEEVISEFNSLVNMTASDLEAWLKSDDANSAGWPKDDADGDGETVGHDSGRKIVEILKANPEKKEDKYTDEQVEHMRKVVAYCKRHLAQESKGNEEKTDAEVKKTKSYASLKNWGHDFLKAEGRDDGEEEEGDAAEEDEDDAAEEEEEEEVSEEDADEEDETKTGDKRKKTGAQNGANKKRETRQGKGSSTNGKTKKDDKEEEDNEEEEDEEDADDDGEENGEDEDEDDADDNKANGGKKTKKGPKKGDTVSWNWGGGQPEGKVLDVKGEDTSITTKNGNTVTRKGDPEDPAVVIDAGKSKAIKSNHELN
ncbi:hypothetical protein ACHAQA_005155 [Verticillium albo-atrum]